MGKLGKGGSAMIRRKSVSRIRKKQQGKRKGEEERKGERLGRAEERKEKLLGMGKKQRGRVRVRGKRNETLRLELKSVFLSRSRSSRQEIG